LSKKLE